MNIKSNDSTASAAMFRLRRDQETGSTSKGGVLHRGRVGGSMLLSLHAWRMLASMLGGLIQRYAVLSLTAFCCGSITHAAVVWQEDFEGADPYADWDVPNGVWEIGVVSGAPSPTNAAVTVLGGNYPATADARLIKLTPFEVPAWHENPRLTFFQAYSFGDGDYASVEVQIVGSTDWVRVSPYYTHTGSDVFTRGQIDLGAYAGKSIRVAFRFVAVNASAFSTDESLGWYLDDIALRSGRLDFDNPEGFETGIGDWYADEGTWEIGVPTSALPHSGVALAGTRLNANYHPTVDSRLISPWFAVPNCGTPRLRFWHWYRFGDGDKGFVELQVRGATNWTKISTDYVGSGGNYTYPSLDLSEFSGKGVRLAFHFVAVNASAFSSDENSGWYIDDVLFPESAVVEIPDMALQTNVGTNLLMTAFTSPASTNLEFTVSAPPGTLANLGFAELTERFELVVVTPQDDNELHIRLTTAEDRPLHGFENVGWFEFRGVAPQSQFVDLTAHSIVASKLDENTVSCVSAWPGRLTLIANEQPLLESWQDQGGQRMISLWGVANSSNHVLFATSIPAPDPWAMGWTNHIPAAMVTNVPVQGAISNAPVLFLRAEKK